MHGRRRLDRANARSTGAHRWRAAGESLSAAARRAGAVSLAVAGTARRTFVCNAVCTDPFTRSHIDVRSDPPTVWATRLAAFLLTVVLMPARAGAAEPAARFLGAGSCSSAGCHASAIADHAPWQSAATVWAFRDPHARAHDVLRDPLAERIVEVLAARRPDLPRVPAREHRSCIGCHATGQGVALVEGVSCESCHGPAERWVVAHTLPGWRTAGNDLGLVDLADPFTCASTCAECHVGGTPTSDGLPREVTHDLVAAGHPRLAFELRSSKRAEPPHWRDRFAAAGQDGAAPGVDAVPGPVDEWALGRLGLLDTHLRQLLVQPTATSDVAQAAGRTDVAVTADPADVWPEFTAFDCYGCHRPPVAAIDRGVPPGRPAASPDLQPLLWAQADLLLPADTAGSVHAVRDAVHRRWFTRPDRAAVEAARAAVHAARADIGKRLAARPDAALAAAILEASDTDTWDESAAALWALEAVVARAAGRRGEAVAGAAAPRLAAARRLLEFDAVPSPAGSVRFDSPRRHDAVAIRAALEAVAALLADAAAVLPAAGSTARVHDTTTSTAARGGEVP